MATIPSSSTAEASVTQRRPDPKSCQRMWSHRDSQSSSITPSLPLTLSCHPSSNDIYSHQIGVTGWQEVARAATNHPATWSPATVTTKILGTAPSPQHRPGLNNITCPSATTSQRFSRRALLHPGTCTFPMRSQEIPWWTEDIQPCPKGAVRTPEPANSGVNRASGPLSGQPDPTPPQNRQSTTIGLLVWTCSLLRRAPS